MAELDVFRARVHACTRSDRWVVDGNYSKSRDIVWGSADTLVYLDYPLPVVMIRLLKRTFSRIIGRKRLWNDNVENWRDTFFSRDSILLWGLRTHSKYRREYLELFRQPEFGHLTVIHLRSQRATQRWLQMLGSS